VKLGRIEASTRPSVEMRMSPLFFCLFPLFRPKIGDHECPKGAVSHSRAGHSQGGGVRKPDTRTPLLLALAYFTISWTSEVVSGTHVIAGVFSTVRPQF